MKKVVSVEELDKKYDYWTKRIVSGSYKSPLLCIYKELKSLGIKKGDRVIIGVKEDERKIEIFPI